MKKKTYVVIHLNMQHLDLQTRANRLSLKIFKLVEKLPQTKGAYVIANQVLRSSSSVRINYRSISLSKSRKDFIYKLNLVTEEADETYGWLLFIAELEFLEKEELNPILDEARQLTYIFSKSLSTAKTKEKRQKDKSKNVQSESNTPGT